MTSPRFVVLLGLIATMSGGPAGCSSADDSAGISYAVLGNLAVNAITGVARNGDLLARATDGRTVRWQAAKSTWAEATDAPPPPFGGLHWISASCEDGTGALWGIGDANLYTVPAGTKTWTLVPLSEDAHPESAVLHCNGSGEIAFQSATSNAETLRVYRKAPTAPSFELVVERAQDSYRMHGISDAGDLFFDGNGNLPLDYAKVLQPGQTELKPVLECHTAIDPACSSAYEVSARGDFVFYGGLGQYGIYRMEATATYPGKAVHIYDRPTDTCCLNGGQGLLNDGTFFARMTDPSNSGDNYILYVRKPGASDWTQSTMPSEDGSHSIIIASDRRSSVYTSSIQLGMLASAGYAYRVNL